jgi:hypothetical protein
MTSSQGAGVRRWSTRVVVSVFAISMAACTEVASRISAPAPSKEVTCIICADGSIFTPQNNAFMLLDGRGGLTPQLPDPNATGPQTSAELAAFGEPTATGVSVLADVHFELTRAVGDGGAIAEGGRAIVSMTGIHYVWSSSQNPLQNNLSCRGLNSCFDSVLSNYKS